jgi:hypothetical protein
MQVAVRHVLAAEVADVFQACTDKAQLAATYAGLGGTDVDIRRDGRAPNFKLRITRRMPADAPGALKRFVPAVNEVAHTENWRVEGDGRIADIVVEIRGVPVRMSGTKSVMPDANGCAVEWRFAVTSGVPLLGSTIAGFAGEQLRAQLEKEFAILRKAMQGAKSGAGKSKRR